jgi:serine/threonine protein phosphatase PrpC
MSLKITIAGLTDIGQRRSRNEDSLGIRSEFGIAVVADGMGGHPHGDLASSLATETVTAKLQEFAESDSGSSRSMDAMAKALLSAHEVIRTSIEENPKLDGMGTTVVTMLIDPSSESYTLGHAGDSRVYLFRDGELTQLTTDDTWVQERLDANHLTAEQASGHPLGHMITQCLGLENRPDPHVSEGNLIAGDIYVLCSDGLTGALADENISEILHGTLGPNPNPQDAEAAVKDIVDAANHAGGHDNITVALLVVTNKN